MFLKATDRFPRHSCSSPGALIEFTLGPGRGFRAGGMLVRPDPSHAFGFSAETTSAPSAPISKRDPLHERADILVGPNSCMPVTVSYRRETPSRLQGFRLMCDPNPLLNGAMLVFMDGVCAVVLSTCEDVWAIPMESVRPSSSRPTHVPVPFTIQPGFPSILLRPHMYPPVQITESAEVARRAVDRDLLDLKNIGVMTPIGPERLPMEPAARTQPCTLCVCLGGLVLVPPCEATHLVQGSQLALELGTCFEPGPLRSLVLPSSLEIVESPSIHRVLEAVEAVDRVVLAFDTFVLEMFWEDLDQRNTDVLSRCVPGYMVRGHAIVWGSPGSQVEEEADEDGDEVDEGGGVSQDEEEEEDDDPFSSSSSSVGTRT